MDINGIELKFEEIFVHINKDDLDHSMGVNTLSEHLNNHFRFKYYYDKVNNKLTLKKPLDINNRIYIYEVDLNKSIKYQSKMVKSLRTINGVLSTISKDKLKNKC